MPEAPEPAATGAPTEATTVATPAATPAAASVAVSNAQPAAPAPAPSQPAPLAEGGGTRAPSEPTGEDVRAEPLEALPEGFWGDEEAPPPDPSDHLEPSGTPESSALLEPAGGPTPSAAGAVTGSLLEHPRFKLVQELFPGRLIAYSEPRQNEPSQDESPLTDEGGASRIDLDETNEPEAESKGESA